MMLIAHCDDDMLFGAPYLIMSKNPIKIMVLTQQSPLRQRELIECVAKTNMDGGNIEVMELKSELLHDSKFRRSNCRPRLTQDIIDHVRAFTNIACIVSHDEKGEYGHPNHREVHQIAAEVGEKCHIIVETFREVWTARVNGLDTIEKDNFRRQRARLLKNYASQNYGRHIDFFDK